MVSQFGRHCNAPAAAGKGETPVGAELLTALEGAGEDGLLEGGAFRDQRLEGLDCTGLDFKRCAFDRCVFQSCDFTGAAFYGCAFTGCCFDRCRLERTYWHACTLTGCKGDGCDLRRARWKECRIADSPFRYANFSGGVFQHTTVSGSNWGGSVLTELRLKDLRLQEVDLTGADLFRTSLKGVDLSGCTIDNITLSETCAELKGAVLDPTQATVVARILGIQIKEPWMKSEIH